MDEDCLEFVLVSSVATCTYNLPLTGHAASSMRLEVGLMCRNFEVSVSVKHELTGDHGLRVVGLLGTL